MGRDVLRGLRDVAWDHKLWIHVLGVGDGVEQVGEAGDQCRLTQGDAVLGSCRDCGVHWPALSNGLAVSGPSVAGNAGTAATLAQTKRDCLVSLFVLATTARSCLNIHRVYGSGTRNYAAARICRLSAPVNRLASSMRGRSFCKTVLINFGFPGWNATVKLLKTRAFRELALDQGRSGPQLVNESASGLVPVGCRTSLDGRLMRGHLHRSLGNLGAPLMVTTA
jgi:hypothetical protein